MTPGEQEGPGAPDGRDEPGGSTTGAPDPGPSPIEEAAAGTHAGAPGGGGDGEDRVRGGSVVTPGGTHGSVEEEAATRPVVAAEEAARDDAGRDLEPDGGWRTQAALFGGVGAFVVLIGAVYWFVAYEWAGATLLALTAALALMTAAYLGWPRRGRPPLDDGHHEPGHDPHDGVWFPEASVWPFAIGAGMVLVGNGLLLGRWLLVPASVLLVWSLAGMIRQGRHRI